MEALLCFIFPLPQDISLRSLKEKCSDWLWSWTVVSLFRFKEAKL